MAIRKRKKSETNELIFKLDDDDIEEALLAFIQRELNFLHNILREPYTVIAERCGVSGQTISNMHQGKSKHPQVRTVFPILASLDLEFDPQRGAIVRKPTVLKTVAQ